MKDYFLLALRNLSHRRTRSFLTIVGIFIGIATVVGLIALGQGLQNTIQGEFNKLGADKITIMGYNGIASSPFVSATTSKPISESDRKATERIRGVDVAGGILFKSTGMEFKGQNKATFAIGVPTDGTKAVFDETQFGDILAGRNLRSSDKDKVIIGYAVSRDAFDSEVEVGDSLSVGGRVMDVIGIYNTVGNSVDDNAIYLPLENMRAQFDEPQLLSMILVKVQKGSDINGVAERIKEKLRKIKEQKEGQETFSVSTPQQLTQQFNTVFGVLTLVLVGIAAISLLVGGIGIMNTMYAAILERTKEIGILKAVGAKHNDILVLFLIESGLLGLLGGVVGVIVGAGLTYGAEAAIRANGYAAFTATLSWELALGALAFSFFVGAISGVLPARSAAMLNPADAIRYE